MVQPQVNRQGFRLLHGLAHGAHGLVHLHHGQAVLVLELDRQLGGTIGVKGHLMDVVMPRPGQDVLADIAVIDDLTRGQGQIPLICPGLVKGHHMVALAGQLLIDHGLGKPELATDVAVPVVILEQRHQGGDVELAGQVQPQETGQPLQPGFRGQCRALVPFSPC